MREWSTFGSMLVQGWYAATPTFPPTTNVGPQELVTNFFHEKVGVCICKHRQGL